MKTEFDWVSNWLLNFHLEFTTSNYVLLAVPGNHDLVRPENHKDITVQGLINLWHIPDVRDEFMENKDSTARTLVDQAFGQYERWWQSVSDYRPKLFYAGILPGDFSATIEKDGARLGVVGLNSSFLQLTDGLYQNRVAVDVRQFNGACPGGDGSEWVDEHHVCLLMTHHPPAWLSQEAATEYNRDIYVAGRFALHLNGHLHEANSMDISQQGSEPRCYLHGCSLFGLEEWKWDKAPGPERKRLFGYSLCQLTLESGFARRRTWPRIVTDNPQIRMVPNQAYVLEPDEGTTPFEFRCRTPRPLSASAVKSVTPAWNSLPILVANPSQPAGNLKLPKMQHVQAGQFWIGTEIDENVEKELDIKKSKSPSRKFMKDYKAF